MRQLFRYACRRRAPGVAVQFQAAFPNGAGSGGSPVVVSEIDTESDGTKWVGTEKTLVLSGNHVAIQADTPLPPTAPSPCLITMLASDMTCTQGRIDAHAIEGIRLTTTGFPNPMIPMSSPETNGVDIIAGELQTVNIKRGVLPIDNFITLTPEMLQVDGGLGPVMIQSQTEITIQVAGGVASITLSPAGIIMQGPIIMIN